MRNISWEETSSLLSQSGVYLLIILVLHKMFLKYQWIGARKAMRN